jgi:hypothetical protein
MTNLHDTSFEYFETDQIKFSVRLWKAIKQSHGIEFDVLRFTQNWSYAESIVVQALTATDDNVSAIALEIMQLRSLFLQKYPERAKKLGAIIAEQPQLANNSNTRKVQLSADSDKDKKPSDEPLKNRYLKSLR